LVYPKQDVAMMKCLTSFCVFFLTFSGVHAAVQTVTESARDLPLAYDVDVVVIGGTTRGVAAAQAAAEAGASVFLAAPRPYLGEDMCGTFRLWLNPDETPQSPLGRALFAGGQAKINGLKYAYTADPQAGSKHPDAKIPNALFNGKYASASMDSVEYASDVTIVADLGSAKGFKAIHLFAFQRDADFVVGEVRIESSDDQKTWTALATIPNPTPTGGYESETVPFSLQREGRARYIRLTATKTAASSRILIGEVVIESSKPLAKVAGVQVTKPMVVKRALDRALLNAEVNFLYGSYVTDVLRDARGALAGVVIANRSGRQAVRAKVVIDATDRGIAARIAGVDVAPYPSGKQTFSRMVMGGVPGAEAIDTGISYVVNPQKGVSYKVYEYLLELPMRDRTWASFAKADQEARNQTWQKGQAGAAEMLYQVPPDPIKGRTQQRGAWPGSAGLELKTLQPAGLDHLYVLGPCADVSRESAAALMRPIAGIVLGQRVGVAAAAAAKARTLAEPIQVQGEMRADAIVADIGEMLNGIRTQPDLDAPATVRSPARSIPVIAKVDTVVVGGGTGGGPAGVGAARGGARTIVVEYLHGLGGVGTLGRISKYYHGNRVGFTAEVDQGVDELTKGSDHDARSGWNIENKMEWLRSEIVKAGGDVWFQSLGVGSVVRGNRFVGVVVATPHGRGVILANSVIDSTGNAVIPACAGLETQVIGGEHISVQGTGLPPFTPGDSYYNTDWTFTDDDDVLDMWRIHVVGRNKYPGAFDQGQLIDTRARRRIIGDITVTPMDIINQRVFPDVVTVAKSNFDNHGFSSHTLFMITPPDKAGLTGNVPYRALMPKDYDGLLVTGLGMSAHGDAMPVMRMQADVQNQGYAAGKATAMAAEEGSTVRTIDVTRLQKHLVEKKIIPQSMIGAKDSYPIGPEQMINAVKSVGEDYTGIAQVLTNPEMALPALREAYAKVAKEDVKLRYAHVLGMLHDGQGSASLIKAVDTASWDKGWNFRGMGQFGASTSPLDNLIIALGRTGDRRGVPTILRKLSQLKPESEFSHYRAVSIAAEQFKDPQFAAPLARLLRTPGIGGHAFLEIDDVMQRTPANITDNTTRNLSLRELVLARALFRCGDVEGLGRNTLMAYASDFRGHYASHAKAILNEVK
jgi:hypothetical protein